MIIFENCLIQAPDGVVLSRCGMKKIDWYVKNGLADIVTDDPVTTIRLRFEPSGRRGLGDPLLLDGKPNICVVCGTNKKLTKHHIIPYSFIKHMQIEYKVDIIRDIFPLCQSCHGDYEKHSQEKRKEMAAALDIPMYGLKSEETKKVRKAMGAAAALQKYNGSIPEDKKDEMRNVLKEFLGKSEITNDDLTAIRRYKITERPDYINFSKHVAERVTDYSEFAREWREHFVNKMRPKHMPDAWKTDRKTKAKDVWVPQRMLNQMK